MSPGALRTGAFSWFHSEASAPRADRNPDNRRIKTMKPLLLSGVMAAALFVSACAGSLAPGVASAASGASVAASEPVAASAPTAAQLAFDDLVADLTARWLTASPETATYLGADEATAGGPHLGRLSTFGVAGREEARALSRDMFAALSSVNPETLDDQRRLTREILLDLLNAGAAVDTAAGGWGEPGVASFTVYPITQLSGLHINLPNLLQAQQPASTPEEAAAYIARMSGFSVAFDDAIDAMLRDAAVGVVPPDFVLEKALAVIERFTAVPAQENIIYVALDEKLGDAGVVGAEGYLVQAQAIIESDIYPAYARLAMALESLLPQASHAPGIDQQPNGAAVYQALIRLNADSELSGDEIHEIGLAEVARISGEMEAILQAQGYIDGTVGERIDALQREQRFLYPNTDEGKAQLIADLNAQVVQIQAMAPDWFGTIPPQPVEVRRVPAFSEESAPGGYYDLPSLDGTRPGIYWINLRDTANNPRFSLPTLTAHEAVPGHHYQIALSLDLEETPLLRKWFAITNAYVEGWALYAEVVAKEMGLYDDDPFGDLGRLQSELFRAVRLVVDTGMHARGWSRERAIDYMVDTGAAIRSDAVIEIERYAAWPGQALGYKMGMLKILELRAYAEAELGDAFDIRAFHDAVLLDGGLPLPLLEARVDEWIAAQQEM